MARDFELADNDRMDHSAAIHTGYPFTYSAWFNQESDVRSCLVGVGDLSTNNDYWFLSTEPGRALTLVCKTGGTERLATTGNLVTDGVWSHCCGLGISATSRQAILDADFGNKGTQTTNLTPVNLDLTRIGARPRATTLREADGLIQEVAIWNVVLTDPEIIALSKGFSPLLVHPSALLAYWPLLGNHSPEIDVVGGFDMTLVNTPVKADHNRVIYPSRPHVITALAAAADDSDKEFAATQASMQQPLILPPNVVAY